MDKIARAPRSLYKMCKRAGKNGDVGAGLCVETRTKFTFIE